MHIRSSTVFNSCLVLAAASFGGHCLLLWLAPFESIHPTTRQAQWLIAIFLVVFFAVAKLMLWKQGPGPRLAERSSSIHLGRVFADSRLLGSLAVVSLVGVCLHMWAKFYLTELHPINCISQIRFAWLEVDRNLLPLHIRIISMLGHLLTAFAYLGLLATSFNIGRAKSILAIRRKDMLLQIFFTLVGALYAGFIGSRNAMLAFLVMSLTGVLLSIAFSGARDKHEGKSWAAPATGVLVPLISAVLFSSMIFSDRLFCYVPDVLSQANTPGRVVSDKTITEFHMSGFYREFDLVPRAAVPASAPLTASAAGHLTAVAGVVAKAGPIIAVDAGTDWRKTLFVDTCSICAPAMVYLSHGIFNFSKVIASETSGSPVLFSFFKTLPKRLGLAPASPNSTGSRVYGPGGVTLAGAAYHDFGIPGVLITAAVLGLMFGLSIRCLQMPGLLGLIGVCLFVPLFYVLLLANIFAGFNVMPFPFIVYGTCLGLMAWFIMQRSSFSENKRLALQNVASNEPSSAQ